MTTKTITIREEVYNLLLSLKREGESFSDLLERLARTTDPMALIHAMEGSIEFADTSQIIDEIRSKRQERSV